MPDARDRAGVREDAARPGADTVRGGTATRGAAVLRLHRRPAHEGRRSSPRVNNVSGRGARREAASLRRDRRPAHVKKTQLGPEYVASALGEAARREAASLLGTADHRMSKVRPRCQRQPRRGHEEPVEATDALRPTGGGRSAESGPSQLPGGGSDPLRPPDQCPASEAINSDSPDGCPAGEGPTSNSNRRTGPRTKG